MNTTNTNPLLRADRNSEDRVFLVVAKWPHTKCTGEVWRDRTFDTPQEAIDAFRADAPMAQFIGLVRVDVSPVVVIHADIAQVNADGEE